MLELSELATWIETTINSSLANYVNSNQDTLLKTDRVTYMFKVDTDIGEHKGFDYIDLEGNISLERTNHIVRYIQAILTQNDSSVDSTSFIDITRNTTLEILVPLNDIDTIDKKNNVVDEIRNVLDNTFSLNGFGATTDGDQFSYEFGLATTGTRNLRTFVGDSVTLLAYMNFYFVENGLNSNKVIIRIDSEIITPIRFGISRGSTQQTNTYSNDTRAVGMNTQTATLFSINFDIVARTTGNFYKELYKHMLIGKNQASDYQEKPSVAHSLHLMIINDSGETITETFKLMKIESVSMSGQNPLIASLSVVMTEEKYIEGLTNISVMAKGLLSNILQEQQ